MCRPYHVIFAYWIGSVPTMERLGQEEEQRVMGISAMLTLPVLLGGAIYVVYLHAIDVIDFNQGILYAFLLVVPAYLGLWFSTYEVLSSRKVKKPLRFHIERFVSRMIVATGYSLCFVALWSVFSFFLSTLISRSYIVLLTLLTSTLTLATLVTVPKTRQIIEKFTKGR